MSTQNLREVLEAKKAEIETALRELDRIEAIAGVTSPKPRLGGKSNSQAVVEAIANEPKSIPELSDLLGLTEEQVYHALTSHRLRRIVKTFTAGEEKKYALRSWVGGKLNESDPPRSLTEAIFDLLDDQSGKPMQTSEITDALLGKVETTAANFRGTVASTLSAMVKAGRIQRSPGQGYFVVQRQIFN